MSSEDRMSAFVGLVVLERYRQRRAKGQGEEAAVALAAADAWEFLETLADDPDLSDDHNAMDNLATWLSAEEMSA